MYSQTIQKGNVVTVSVGICATTEIDNAIALVDEILSYQDAQIDLKEVLVATPNHSLATKLTNHDSRLAVLLETRRRGKTAALNRIMEQTSGEILVLASADIRLSPKAIPKLVKALDYNSEWGAVDARVELANGETQLMDRVDHILWDLHNAALDDLDSRDDLGHAGDLLAVRRELIHKFPDVINDDSFLALSIRDKGFKVKRLKEALVWIVGPRNALDYVLQRSRILRGHLQLISQYGKMPTTLEFSVLRKPGRTLRFVVHTVARRGPPSLLLLFVGACLEFISLQVAVFSSLLNRQSRTWRIVPTTKSFETNDGWFDR